MKTTVEISDALLERTKAIAKRDDVTLRALVEEGLRQVISRREQRQRFELRRASFGGEGLQPGVREGSWETLRELIYEGRGG